MQITELPAAPDPFNDTAEEFGAKAAAFVQAQQALVPELNQKLTDYAAQLNALAAGGAYALAYTVDASSTAAGDPGANKLRFNASPANTATALYVDTVSGGFDVSALLNDLAASSSAIKGTIRLQAANDLSKWMVFNVTAVTSNTGYHTITVVNRSSSAPGPFSDGVQVMMFFQPTGDKGSTGPQGSGYQNLVVLTSSGTWQPPAGVTKAEVTVIDGGYSGACHTSYAAEGGRGGNASVSIITVDPAVTYTATVGAGGVAGAGGTNTASQAGGASSFSGTGITTLTSSNGTEKLFGGPSIASNGSLVSSYYIGGAGPLGGARVNAVGGGSGAGNAPSAYGAGGPGTGTGNAGVNGNAGAIIIKY